MDVFNGNSVHHGDSDMTVDCIASNRFAVLILRGLDIRGVRVQVNDEPEFHCVVLVSTTYPNRELPSTLQ